MIARTARTFWIDENLPPVLAEWIGKQPESSAVHFRDLGFSQTPDREVFSEAREAGAVLVSKDEDFAQLVTTLGSPPQVVWVRLGNCKTGDLIANFERHFDSLRGLLDDGNPLIALES